MIRSRTATVPLAAALAALALCGCAAPAQPTGVDTAPITDAAPITKMDGGEQPPAGAQPRLAEDPAQIGRDLVADELALRDPATPEQARVSAARRQQVAYRAIGRNPQWDNVIRPEIPESLIATYDRNLDARRQLTALAPVRDTLPAWRIIPPAPAEELLSFYRDTEAATGVGWNYLAAINLIETRFGSVAGTSTAGAQGPMQFMPATWAAYGHGGDVNSPRDAIMSAGRYLAASGFATNPDRAIFAYNHADEYVRAVNDYAALLAEDPAAFGGYYLWEVYYYTTAGDVLLPVGYDETSRIPVAGYLTTHPQ